MAAASALGKDIKEIADLIASLTRDLLLCLAVEVGVDNVSVDKKGGGGGKREQTRSTTMTENMTLPMVTMPWRHSRCCHCNHLLLSQRQLTSFPRRSRRRRWRRRQRRRQRWRQEIRRRKGWRRRMTMPPQICRRCCYFRCPHN